MTGTLIEPMPAWRQHRRWVLMLLNSDGTGRPQTATGRPFAHLRELLEEGCKRTRVQVVQPPSDDLQGEDGVSSVWLQRITRLSLLPTEPEEA